MAVVTITTDLGTADFYLAAFKGSLYKQCGEIAIVDVNCQIRHFDIKQAVYHLQQAYSYFPDGTIHLVHINPDFASNKLLIASFKNQFFVSFDNGFLPLFFKENNVTLFSTNSNLLKANATNGYNNFALVVQHIISNKSFSSIASNVSDYKKMSLPNATGSLNGIKGNIVSIDAYGNAVTNISKDFFEAHLNGKRFSVRVNRLLLYEIKNNYSDAVEGDLLCFFNDSGLLEIALNKGKASSLLGLSVSQSVIIASE